MLHVKTAFKCFNGLRYINMMQTEMRMKLMSATNCQEPASITNMAAKVDILSTANNTAGLSKRSTILLVLALLFMLMVCSLLIMRAEIWIGEGVWTLFTMDVRVWISKDMKVKRSKQYMADSMTVDGKKMNTKCSLWW